MVEQPALYTIQKGATMKKPTQKEKIIENDILTWLNYQGGVFAFKVNTSGFYDTKRGVFRKNLSPFLIPGTPDIFCVFNIRDIPVAVFMEVKSSKGKQSENQKHFEQVVAHHGGFYYVVRSIEDAESALMNIKLRVQNAIAGPSG